ncbi:MAG: peptidoglycan DD-metalloendopeptidase family protein, partial [Planctomycetota bacterium]
MRADWIILKDGRAARVVQGKGPVTQVEFPDGKRRDVERGEIARRLTDRLFDREVDLLAIGLGRNSSREASKRRLEQLGAAAVGRLLVRLKGRDKVLRAMALTALQFCWAPDAREPILAATKDRDPTIRRLATAVVRQHLGDDVAKVLASQISDPDPHVAGPAIQAAEEKGPDLDRMLAAMAKPALWRYVHPHLPRYHSSRLTELTHRMLDRGSNDEKVSAICSLIHQQDNSAKTRQKIAALLRSPYVDLRDMAAEYLRWHGTAAERPALADKLKSENDPYARASAAAAMEAIDRRAKRFKPGGQAGATPWPDKPADAYAAALKALTAAPNEAARQRVVALLAGAEPFEPYYRYEERAQLRSTPPSGGARDATLMRLLNLAFGYPPPPGVQPSSDDKAPAGVAKTLIGPVRRYLDPKRKSYGLRSKGGVGPFAGTTHVGDDVAWRKPHATVVAIGDGVVRRVRVGAITWGGLVVVEHTGPDGKRFCSLYAHLGPLVCVRSGQTVKKGQQLGAIGRTHTWEGGGYGAHLHFGI